MMIVFIQVQGTLNEPQPPHGTSIALSPTTRFFILTITKEHKTRLLPKQDDITISYHHDGVCKWNKAIFTT